MRTTFFKELENKGFIRINDNFRRELDEKNSENKEDEKNSENKEDEKNSENKEDEKNLEKEENENRFGLGTIVEEAIVKIKRGINDLNRIKSIQKEIVEISKLIEYQELYPYTEDDEEIIPAENEKKFEEIKQIVEKELTVAKTKLLLALQAQARSRMTYNLKKGRLNSRSLHRLVSNTSSQIFKKKTLGKSLNTAITFAIDMSFSMLEGKQGAPNRIETAKRLCVLFGTVLNKVKGVKFEIVGCNTGKIKKDLRKSNYSRINAITYHKFHEFNDDWALTQKRLGSVKAESNCVTNEFILWAARRLAQQKADRKILITLEDGAPLCCSSKKFYRRKDLLFLLQEDQKRNANYIRNSGIEVYCIAIGSLFPARTYGIDNVIEIDDYDSSIDSKFFKLLADLILH